MLARNRKDRLWFGARPETVFGDTGYRSGAGRQWPIIRNWIDRPLFGAERPRRRPAGRFAASQRRQSRRFTISSLRQESADSIRWRPGDHPAGWRLAPQRARRRAFGLPDGLTWRCFSTKGEKDGGPSEGGGNLAGVRPMPRISVVRGNWRVAGPGVLRGAAFAARRVWSNNAQRVWRRARFEWQ